MDMLLCLATKGEEASAYPEEEGETYSVENDTISSLLTIGSLPVGISAIRVHTLFWQCHNLPHYISLP